MGYLTGLGFGAAYGLLRAKVTIATPVSALILAAAATVGSNLPVVISGLTDPRRWSVAGWAEDLFPHLSYGLATATVYDYVAGPR